MTRPGSRQSSDLYESRTTPVLPVQGRIPDGGSPKAKDDGKAGGTDAAAGGPRGGAGGAGNGLDDSAPTETLKVQVRRQLAVTDEQVRHARRHQPRASSSRGSSSGSGITVSRFPSGTILADRYRIIRMLGRGGMGEVYCAEDLELGELVAIKLLPELWEHDAARLKRLRDEVRLARSVTHPHVCRVYDIGEAEGRRFLSMEYIDGEDLDALLRRIGCLPVNEALEIGVQICQGLAAIHESGILHRDLKPANLILDTRGRVRIADFGLASVVHETPEHGVVQGTPAYMAPEQLGAQEVSIQSDLYALGLILHKLLTGKPAFEARTPQDLYRLRTESAPPSPSSLVTGIPAAIDALIVRCLAPDPRARPASAREVATALADSTALVPAPALVVVVACAGLDRAALVARSGEELAARVAQAHGQVVDGLCAQHAGARVRGSDAALAVFDHPGWAVAYALAYQRALAALAQREGVALASGVGMHLGVRPRQDAGAARPEADADTRALAVGLCALAEPGQILLTRSVFDLARQDSLSELGKIQWRAHGSYELAGMGEPVEVCEVGVEGTAPLVPPRESALAKRRLVQDVVAGWRPAPGLELPQRSHWIMEKKLGEGGFGEVWLAAHEKTHERRVFKFCYDAGRLRALQREITLFRLLKETLGDRDDIVRILDWSFEEAPYFIESVYTAGGNLIGWAAERGGLAAIALETRLEIVAQVATALAAAHSVGVLHKDVKPANVLMTMDAAGSVHAQLGDFGIGAILEKGHLAEIGITALGLTMDARTALLAAPEGTRLYMAPELLEGKPATIQADIYALGVMLYQVVFGNFARALAPGWERDIDDELLRADIAAAVDGDPGRRLGNAGHLAERLRTLAERKGELAVLRREREEADRARAALVRARKRRKITALAGALLVLFAGTVTVQSLRIAREAEAAADAAMRAAVAGQTAQQVSDFLVSLFEEADPYASQGRDVTARALLDRGKQKIDALAAEPAVQAELMHVMGVVYGNLGLDQDAAALLQAAIEQRRKLPGSRPLEVAESLHALARTLEHQRVYKLAESAAREALGVRRELLGSEHADTVETMEVLANVLAGLGRYDEAESLYREVLARRQRRFGAEHAKVAQTLRNMGNLQLQVDKQEAARRYRESRDMYRRISGERTLEFAKATYFLGVAESSLGDYQAAEPRFLQSLAITRDLLGEDHPAHYPAMAQLARIYQRTGEYAKAEPLWHSVLAFYRASTGEKSLAVAAVLNDLAFLARAQGDCARANELSQGSLSMYRSGLEGDHALTATSLYHRGYLLASWGRPVPAEASYQQSLDMYRRLHGEAHPFTAMLMASLAELRLTQGDLEQAEHLLVRAADVLQRQPAQDAWLLPYVESVRGVYLSKTGDLESAERLLLRSYEAMKTSHGAHRMYTKLAASRLLAFYESLGRQQELSKYRSLPIDPHCAPPP